MSAAVKVLLSVLVAAVITGAVLAWTSRDPAPKPVAAHVAIAPGASVPRADGKVAGTTMTAQQAADAAIEDGRHPDLVPLSARDFDRPIARYRAYAVGQARLLARAARRGEFGEAFDRWLLAGAAYGALGDLDTQINEALDRHDGPALAAAARRLPHALETAELEPLDYATRAHEILEDVQRDRLDDASGVRATADGVAATRTVIGTLRDVLAGRGDVLQLLDTRLTRLERTLAGIRREHGAWPAPDQ